MNRDCKLQLQRKYDDILGRGVSWWHKAPLFFSEAMILYVKYETLCSCTAFKKVALEIDRAVIMTVSDMIRQYPDLFKQEYKYKINSMESGVDSAVDHFDFIQVDKGGRK